MEAQSELGPKDPIVIDLGKFSPAEQKAILSLHGFTKKEEIESQGIGKTLEMANQAKADIEDLLKPEAGCSAKETRRVLNTTLGHLEIFHQRYGDVSRTEEPSRQILTNIAFILNNWVSRPALTALTDVDCSQGPIILNLPKASS